MSRYVEIKTDTKYGMSAISSKVISDIAYGVLEDMPSICLCQNAEEIDKKCKVCVIKPIFCRMNDGGATLYLHVHIQKNENASDLCQNIQREISDQIQSMLELKKIDVQIKIDGII